MNGGTYTTKTGLALLTDRQLVRLHRRMSKEFLRVHGWLVAARAESERRAKMSQNVYTGESYGP